MHQSDVSPENQQLLDGLPHQEIAKRIERTWPTTEAAIQMIREHHRLVEWRYVRRFIRRRLRREEVAA
jgi:hypothetical protein